MSIKLIGSKMLSGMYDWWDERVNNLTTITGLEKDPLTKTSQHFLRWAEIEKQEALVEVLDVIGCWLLAEQAIPNSIGFRRRDIDSELSKQRAAIWANEDSSALLVFFRHSSEKAKSSAYLAWLTKQHNKDRAYLDVLAHHETLMACSPLVCI